ncbi:ABC transporter membrane protein [Klebsiella quasipneumoniae]|nr:ABC transporter membrane protein [Klebsiella quasipneumoniae]
MFHRLWTLIRKELQSLLREPQTRAILIMPVLIQVLLFPFAATLEVTNATIAIYNEDSGRHAVELTQRFARAKAFTHVLLLKSPQAIQPTIDEQKALLVVRFPADFSRNLDNYQTAPLQLLLDGRNSNSAQIAANYLQQVVKNYQQELLEDKAKPNNSELVVRNWYNPNLDYKWFVVPSLIAMITTIGVMIVTSLSVAREREQGTLDQLLVSPLATWQIFVGKAVPALIVATPAGDYRAGDWYLGLSDPVCRLAAAVLFHHGDLRSVAGGIWLIDLIAMFNATAGVYWRVRLYDAGDSSLRLCFTGGKHAAVAAGSDVDKPDPPLYRYHQANLFEGCESGDCVGKFVAATGHSGHHRLSGVCDVPKKDCVIFYLSPAARPPPGLPVSPARREPAAGCCAVRATAATALSWRRRSTRWW